MFVGSYGGVEHDSGWFLGVAKNLALRGIYASYTNTIIKEGVGAFPSIHDRYSVQDAKGFVYFPAAVTVGPGYIIPEALIIKLFGSGWWQYRAWPLIAFTLMLFLALFVVWRIGGILALLFFTCWLWVIPQFTTQFAYEAFSEDIAFLFLLAGFFLLFLSEGSKRSILLSFLAGICMSFSYLTKTLFLLPIMGFVVFTQWDFFNFRENRKYWLKKWVVFVVGAIIPIALFFVYEYTYVLSHFGMQGWNAVQEDSRLVFVQLGSGIDFFNVFFSQNIDFMYKKYLIWMDVGSNLPIICWIAFLLSPLVFLYYLKKREKVLSLALYIASFLSFLWYMFLSTDGWGRHIWQGLMIGMMLMSISIGLIYKHYHFKNKQLFLIILGLVCLIFTNYSVLSFTLVLPASTIKTWATVRSVRGLDGFPSLSLPSLADQKQLVNYFSDYIKPNDRIYYLTKYLNAEVSPLVDKVFYPLMRFASLNQTNPFGGKSYLIIGPYQQGLWSLEPVGYVPYMKKFLCKKVVLQNPSYLLCTLKHFAVK